MKYLIVVLLLAGCSVDATLERAVMDMRDGYSSSLTTLVSDRTAGKIDDAAYVRIESGRKEASQAIDDASSAVTRYRHGMAVMEAR